MFTIGKYNKLKVKHLVKGGCYLYGKTRDIYLSKKDTPKNISVGDEIEVFIYNDAKDSLKATTAKPYALVGEFAFLKVKDVTTFGVFLDWGIEKDLFVPRKYVKVTLRPGMKVLVYVMLDYEKKGIIGSCYTKRYIKKETGHLKENESVEILVIKETSLGFKVIINNSYFGLIYKNEIFQDIHIGDKKKGYIKKVRDDGQIDVALQPQGFIPASIDARETILKALKDNHGFLPLTDKTDPEKIKRYLTMSKKLFKKIIGGLYKEKIISIEKNGIRLQSK